MIETWVCPVCQKVIKFDKIILPIQCRCGNIYREIEVNTEPGTLQKFSNFVCSLYKDVSEGGGRCTQEEINERLAKCKECPLYKPNGDKGICTHKKCGCNVSSEQKFLNKLYWKSQKCPIGQW